MTTRALIPVLLASAVLAWGQATEPLRFERAIEMPEVQGRIDHMSLDIKGGRLFVSALGNGTVEILSIKTGKRLRTIGPLPEPQGVLYVPETNRLYVANGEDGSVRVFDAASYEILKTLDYGDDADNLRYDSQDKRIFVGYGSGALGEIDDKGNKVADIKLDAHPESFQLEKNSSRSYVNLPNSHKVAVLDREKHSVVGTWKTDTAFANFPMALDESEHRLFVVTRQPARLLVFDTTTGKIIQELHAVGDCDDVFYDSRRKRIYASGGDGAISVFAEADPDHYSELGRVITRKGARTSFFSPELDRLFLAVRRQGSQPAAIQVFAPAQ
jgi:DNA-binding beta-propeller fold protein YncE